MKNAAPILVLGALALGYTFRKEIFGGGPTDAVDFIEEVNPSPAVPAKSPAATPAKVYASTGFPLHQGSAGEAVKAVQKVIGVSVDGKFGPLTEAALVKRTGLKTLTEAQYYDLVRSAAPIPTTTATTATNLTVRDLAYNALVAVYEPVGVTAENWATTGYWRKRPVGQISAPKLRVVMSQPVATLNAIEKAFNERFKALRVPLNGSTTMIVAAPVDFRKTVALCTDPTVQKALQAWQFGKIK